MGARSKYQSIAVRPSDCGCEYVGYGGFLNRVGRNVEAVDAFKRAQDMMPLGADVNANFAQSLLVIGRTDEARKIAAKALDTWPDYPLMLRILVRSAFWTGSRGEALKLLSVPGPGWNSDERAALANAVRALQSGNAASEANAVKALEQLAMNNTADGELLITALAALGAKDSALAVAARHVERDGLGALAVLFEPALAVARHSPQFAQIAERFGLTDYWRQSRRPPDFCKEASAPALCATLRP